MYAPIGGEIVEINEALDDADGDPGLLNTSPMEAGWIIKIKIENPAEIDGKIEQIEQIELGILSMLTCCCFFLLLLFLLLLLLLLLLFLFLLFIYSMHLRASSSFCRSYGETSFLTYVIKISHQTFHESPILKGMMDQATYDAMLNDE